MTSVEVEVVGASMKFGDSVVFADFNAHFPAARVTALVGPSGSGKSTLMAAMSGYQKLSLGRIDLRYALLASPQAPDPERVAWVPQGSNALGRRTVLDNVAIAALSAGHSLHDARDQAINALETVGLGALLDRQARHLSGGELQRTALARALASGKDLILADEPSANLDAANTDLIAAILHDLTSQATIIVATHDPVLVTAAHATVHMRPVVVHAA